LDPGNQVTPKPPGIDVKQEPRYVHVQIHLDTNLINARGHISAVNQLERWGKDDVIGVELSEVAGDEVARAGALHRRKALEYIWTETLAETDSEQEDLRRIAKTLFPGGPQSPGEWRDVEIVFNARKYGAILVTNDGASKRQPRGILGAAEDLKALGVRAMTAEDAVLLVCEQIQKRDDRARLKHDAYDLPLPAWVGRD
jgi:hypothetical protein